MPLALPAPATRCRRGSPVAPEAPPLPEPVRVLGVEVPPGPAAPPLAELVVVVGPRGRQVARPSRLTDDVVKRALRGRHVEDGLRSVPPFAYIIEEEKASFAHASATWLDPREGYQIQSIFGAF